MNHPIVQDYYADELSICYGCGRLNAQGLHVQTRWDGHMGHSTFIPRPEHTAFPGIVYGGLLASLIDCHSIGTATAALLKAEGRALGEGDPMRCVTAQLNTTFLRPTPMGVELVLRAQVAQMTERKAVVHTSIFAGEVETVRGEVVAVRARG